MVTSAPFSVHVSCVLRSSEVTVQMRVNSSPLATSCWVGDSTRLCGSSEWMEDLLGAYYRVLKRLLDSYLIWWGPCPRRWTGSRLHRTVEQCRIHWPLGKPELLDRNAKHCIQVQRRTCKTLRISRATCNVALILPLSLEKFVINNLYNASIVFPGPQKVLTPLNVSEC